MEFHGNGSFLVRDSDSLGETESVFFEEHCRLLLDGVDGEKSERAAECVASWGEGEGGILYVCNW